MRNFLISVFCLGILIASWCCFNRYSDQKLQDYIYTIETKVIAPAEADHWKAASVSFELLSQDWNNYKTFAAFFLDTQLINEADYSFAKIKYYLKARDISNAAGELSTLQEQMNNLHYNEELNASNLF